MSRAALVAAAAAFPGEEETYHTTTRSSVNRARSRLLRPKVATTVRAATSRPRGGDAACSATDGTNKKKKRGRVSGIHYFPVKGLPRVELTSTVLVEGGCIAHDREWAVMLGSHAHEWDPESPKKVFVVGRCKLTLA